MRDLVQLLSHGSITEVAICRPEAFNDFDMELLVQERRLLSEAADRPHGQEGMKAFAEKRKPNFVPVPSGRLRGNGHQLQPGEGPPWKI